MHSLFGWGGAAVSAGTNFQYKPGRLLEIKENFRGCRVLLIDEMSMVSPSNLGLVNLCLQQIMGNNMPFGNISIILSGDFAQIPPVPSGYGLYNGVMDVFAFNGDTSSKAKGNANLGGVDGLGTIGADLFRHFAMLPLEQQMRAAEDPVHCHLISNLRDMAVDRPLRQDVIDRLTERTISRDDVRADPTWRFAPVVVCKNEVMDCINEIQIQEFAKAHDQPCYWWPITTSTAIEGRVEGVLVQRLKDAGKWTTMCEQETGLKGMFCVGAPCFLNENINVGRGLANGTAAHMVSLSFDNHQPGLEAEARQVMTAARPGQLVRLPGCPSHINVEIQGYQKPPCESIANPDGTQAINVSDQSGPLWEHSTIIDGRAVVPVPLSRSDQKVLTGSVELRPGVKSPIVKLSVRGHMLDIGFSVTYWKCQGKTMPKVILDLNKQPTVPRLNLMMVYVGLTRVRKGEDLRILSGQTPFAGSKGLRKGFDAGPFQHLLKLEHSTALRAFLMGFKKQQDSSLGGTVHRWDVYKARSAADTLKTQTLERTKAEPARKRKTCTATGPAAANNPIATAARPLSAVKKAPIAHKQSRWMKVYHSAHDWSVLCASANLQGCRVTESSVDGNCLFDSWYQALLDRFGPKYVFHDQLGNGRTTSMPGSHVEVRTFLTSYMTWLLGLYRAHYLGETSFHHLLEEFANDVAKNRALKIADLFVISATDGLDLPLLRKTEKYIGGMKRNGEWGDEVCHTLLQHLFRATSELLLPNATHAPRGAELMVHHQVTGPMPGCRADVTIVFCTGLDKDNGRPANHDRQRHMCKHFQPCLLAEKLRWSHALFDLWGWVYTSNSGGRLFPPDHCAEDLVVCRIATLHDEPGLNAVLESSSWMSTQCMDASIDACLWALNRHHAGDGTDPSHRVDWGGQDTMFWRASSSSVLVSEFRNDKSTSRAEKLEALQAKTNRCIRRGEGTLNLFCHADYCLQVQRDRRETMKRVVVPLNVTDNHWIVGLIEFNQDGNPTFTLCNTMMADAASAANEEETVLAFDILTSIAITLKFWKEGVRPDVISVSMAAEWLASATYQLFSTAHSVYHQFDTVSCGPMSIFNLLSLGARGSKPVTLCVQAECTRLRQCLVQAIIARSRALRVPVDGGVNDQADAFVAEYPPGLPPAHELRLWADKLAEEVVQRLAFDATSLSKCQGFSLTVVQRRQ